MFLIFVCCVCLTTGYTFPSTLSNVAEKGTVACVSASAYFIYSPDLVYQNRFRMGFYLMYSFVSSFELYVISGDAEIKLPLQSRKISFPGTGRLDFDVGSVTGYPSLVPGTKYKVSLTTKDGPMLSDVITTFCYCDVIDGDKTGKPKSPEALQTEGYVTFTFYDNSQ
jgi:hypothetical protein